MGCVLTDFHVLCVSFLRGKLRIRMPAMQITCTRAFCSQRKGERDMQSRCGIQSANVVKGVDAFILPLQKAIEEHIRAKKQKGTLIDRIT